MNLCLQTLPFRCIKSQERVGLSWDDKLAQGAVEPISMYRHPNKWMPDETRNPPREVWLLFALRSVQRKSEPADPFNGGEFRRKRTKGMFQGNE